MSIKHWILPNKTNGFHPIALRSSGLMVFAVLFLSIPLLYNVSSTNQFKVLGYATNVNINDVFSLSNQERINAGLKPLALNPNLSNAAAAKANDMMADNYWAHVAPDGTTPWQFITSSGYSYSAAGENLAKDFNTSSGVVTGWMGSALHRDNVLSSTYVDVGYAVLNGTLVGSETTLVVAMYGSPAQIAVTQPTSETKLSNTSTPPSTNQQNLYTPSTNPTVSVNQPTNTKTTENTPINNEAEQDSMPVLPKSGEILQLTNHNVNDSPGSVEGLSTYLSLKTYNTLNWGQKASLLLLFTLVLLFIMKHTIIWRQNRKNLKYIWLRSHPLGQALVLSIVMLVTALSGIGVVL